MADARFDITTLKPVLAYVGVTDLAVEKVRDVVADVQKRVAVAQKDVSDRLADIQKQADREALRETIEARVAELQAEALTFPTRVQGTLQKTVDDNVADATAVYAELVKRGESLVGRIRRQQSTRATASSARTTVTKAKTTTTQATKAADAQTTATKKTAAKKAATTKSTAKSTAEAVKSTAKKSTAKKSTPRKSAAQKTAASKTAAAQSSAKATTTAAQKTAANAVQAVTDAAQKVGD